MPYANHRFFRRSCVASAIFAAIYALSATPLLAQIIEEQEDGYRPPSHSGEFFGKAITTRSGSGAYKTFFQTQEIGYDTRFASDRGRLYLSGIATSTDLRLELERKESAPTDDPDIPPRMVTELKDSDVQVRDAFLQYDLSDDLTAYLGRRRVSWGQFELVSPVTITLPLTPQTSGLTSGKIDVMMPQDQLALSWFVNERVELQAYHFASTRMDPLFVGAILGQTEDEIYTQDMGVTKLTEVPAEVADVEAHTHYAARALFYMDWGTLGLTYHRGRNSFSFGSNMATLHCDRGDSGMPTMEICPPTKPINLRRHTDLPAVKNYGIEVAMPLGRWTYKAEFLRRETVESLDGESVPPNCVSIDTKDQCMGVHGNMRNYLNQVILQNGGRLYMPVTSNIFAVGADSDRDDWRFNLTLFYINEQFEKPALIEAEKTIQEEEEPDVSVFPAINIARYTGGDKKSEVGMVLGFVAPFVGGSLYYKSEFREGLRYLVGLEAFTSIRDQLLIENDENRYDLVDELATGLRFSLIYEF